MASEIQWRTVDDALDRAMFPIDTAPGWLTIDRYFGKVEGEPRLTYYLELRTGDILSSANPERQALLTKCDYLVLLYPTEEDIASAAACVGFDAYQWRQESSVPSIVEMVTIVELDQDD
jgi:hypothetical protein